MAGADLSALHHCDELGGDFFGRSADVWHVLNPPFIELANRHGAGNVIVIPLVLLDVQEINNHANVGFGHTSASQTSAGSSIRNDEHIAVTIGLNEVNDVFIFRCHIVRTVYL